MVVGRSKNVGMPIAMMLHSDMKHDSGLGMDATVTICHRYTPKEKLEYFCRNADIIISATGMQFIIHSLKAHFKIFKASTYFNSNLKVLIKKIT